MIRPEAPRPIAPGETHVVTLPELPSGEDFQILEINEDLSEVEERVTGAPIEFDLHGPSGTGPSAEDELLDVLEAHPPPFDVPSSRPEAPRRRRA
jgi:hypothetical protein